MTASIDKQAAVRHPDLVDAAQFVSDSYDLRPEITISDLQFIESGSMHPNDLPWMDKSYPDEHGETRADTGKISF